MSQHVRSLEDKIRSRHARVAVIGLGYVGLPLCVEFAEAGFSVTGIDVDPRKVAGINAGRSHVEDVSSSELAPLVRSRKIRARDHYRGCGKFDAILICVPTPLRKTKDPDISYIVSALDQVSREVRPGQVIVLESTTYPGTTEEILRPKLEAGGLKAGKDFFLAFSPERVDPGNERFHTRNTPKVVGGITPECTRRVRTLYSKVIDRLVADIDSATKHVHLLYYIFANDETGRKIAGHHAAANFTVSEGRMSFTPTFLGSSPMEVQSGRYAGLMALSQEGQRGIDFMNSLDNAQQKQAKIADEAASDVFEGPGRRNSLERNPRPTRPATAKKNTFSSFMKP